MSLADLFRQLSILIGLPAVLLAGAAAATIVIARDWRLVLFAYAALSVLMALLLAQIVPVEWALQQTISGGLIAVMLYLSARQLSGRSDQPPDLRWPILASMTSLRMLAVGLAAATFFIVHDSIQLPELDSLFRDAVLWLALVGLLGLALHEEPLHAGVSLLVFLNGCELLIFSLTQQQTLVGIAQAGQVLLGLAIAYLMLARGLAEHRTGDRPTEDIGGQP